MKASTNIKLSHAALLLLDVSLLLHLGNKFSLELAPIESLTPLKLEGKRNLQEKQTISTKFAAFTGQLLSSNSDHFKGYTSPLK